ncbi:MAG: hypothetical protein LAP39_25480 [Acidobacteriia bacterium]|nr:hypothetical protein [Terriglobia bacterium]
MRHAFLSFVLSIILHAQTSPVRLGDPVNLISPATDAQGFTVLFGASVAPDGTAQKGTNLYLFGGGSIRQLTHYAGDSNLTGVTSVTYAESVGFGAFTSLPTGPGGAEEVHLIDRSSAEDRTLVSDHGSCIQPACVSCFRPCVGPVHLSADASKALYAVARQQPFFVVNGDGTGLVHLPVYSGSLAPSPQRVISLSGLFVFTSSAPSGPTFAAAATDVYTMNLAGTALNHVTKFGSAMFFASNATMNQDGSLIAFESNFSVNGAPQNNQIWLVHLDGSGLRQISTGPDLASDPSISADGSVVTFLQSGQIKRVDTSGDGIVLTLTKLSISAPRNPALSQDGAQLVFTRGPQSGSAAAVYRIPTDSASNSLSSLGIYAPHLLNSNGVASAAGYGAPSPGSLISVYGANLGSAELTQANVFPLPMSLDSVSLLVNGQPVPVLAVTPWQINAQLPQSTPAASATFQVRVGSVALPSASVEVNSVSPENFVFPFTRGNLSYSQAAAFHAGTGIAADMDHPAAAGETLEIYGLGFGVTDPVVDAGVPSPASPPARARQMPQLQIGGVKAAITFAGLTPGLAGVYQVNAVVPAGLASGLQNLTWIGPGGPVNGSSIAVQ